jgi:NADH-quinone oxidoreductase subunit E
MNEGGANLVADIAGRYGGDPDMLIPMMQDLQREVGYIPKDRLRELSRRLGVPFSRSYSIATFYASFRLAPPGEHGITLCMGTVCYLKGADKISQAVQREFAVAPGATSADGKFTFSPVNCVGACAVAPVMVVDGAYYGGLTPGSAVEILNAIAAGEKVAGVAPPKCEGGQCPCA